MKNYGSVLAGIFVACGLSACATTKGPDMPQVTNVSPQGTANDGLTAVPVTLQNGIAGVRLAFSNGSMMTCSLDNTKGEATIDGLYTHFQRTMNGSVAFAFKPKGGAQILSIVNGAQVELIGSDSSRVPATPEQASPVLQMLSKAQLSCASVTGGAMENLAKSLKRPARAGDQLNLPANNPFLLRTVQVVAKL